MDAIEDGNTTGPDPSRRLAEAHGDTAAAGRAAPIKRLRVLLLLHAILAVIGGLPLWLSTLGFGVMGESATTLAALTVGLLLVLVPTPPLNLLAVRYLAPRPDRARRYLTAAAVPACMQAAAAALYATGIGVIAVALVAAWRLLYPGMTPW
ncbi:hypothetical protein LO763_20115 [Glycomyces sp. A-F 0318]|uniref:hypothetical protein n=1 Tax=Glycomyces amatae TaxID=2881355 RepID=UPI001E29BA6C|nr:hypothetical protein [Glycomyces amatae]MCD0445920.1 hypothetical protein [Glycomyces amatae]